MSLWKLEFFVEGKHLEKALTAVAGFALNMSAPQPVTNAVKKGGKLIQAGESASMKDTLIAHLASSKGKQVTTAEMKKFWEENGGGSKDSVNSALMTSLIEAKVLKRKDRGVFQIL